MNRRNERYRAPGGEPPTDRDREIIAARRARIVNTETFTMTVEEAEELNRTKASLGLPPIRPFAVEGSPS